MSLTQRLHEHLTKCYTDGWPREDPARIRDAAMAWLDVNSDGLGYAIVGWDVSVEWTGAGYNINAHPIDRVAIQIAL